MQTSLESIKLFLIEQKQDFLTEAAELVLKARVQLNEVCPTILIDFGHSI
jgi:hypothetical protein